jgi:hypothetical protein
MQDLAWDPRTRVNSAEIDLISVRGPRVGADTAIRGPDGAPSYPPSAGLTRRVPVRLRLKDSSLATREIPGPRSWRGSEV